MNEIVPPPFMYQMYWSLEECSKELAQTGVSTAVLSADIPTSLFIR